MAGGRGGCVSAAAFPFASSGVTRDEWGAAVVAAADVLREPLAAAYRDAAEQVEAREPGDRIAVLDAGIALGAATAAVDAIEEAMLVGARSVDAAAEISAPKVSAQVFGVADRMDRRIRRAVLDEVARGGGGARGEAGGECWFRRCCCEARFGRRLGRVAQPVCVLSGEGGGGGSDESEQGCAAVARGLHVFHLVGDR